MHYHTLMIFSAVLFLAAQIYAQQNPTPHQKVLTPEQKVCQQEHQSWLAHHQQLQSQAKGIFDQEIAQERAGDCTGASSNNQYIAGFGKLADAAEESLKSYETTIHELLIRAPQMAGAPTAGPAGPALTSPQLIAEFDSVENTWRQYREIACSAAFHQLDGGTGGPSFRAECELRLTRNHMRELDLIYANVLHL
jgi:uncharacterized protein YecT (DUF1311 family)